jgi:hypothetical protein
VSPVRYEVGFYIPEDDILHSHRRETLKFYACGLSTKVGIIFRRQVAVAQSVYFVCELRATEFVLVCLQGIFFTVNSRFICCY